MRGHASSAISGLIGNAVSKSDFYEGLVDGTVKVLFTTGTSNTELEPLVRVRRSAAVIASDRSVVHNERRDEYSFAASEAGEKRRSSLGNLSPCIQKRIYTT